MDSLHNAWPLLKLSDSPSDESDTERRRTNDKHSLKRLTSQRMRQTNGAWGCLRPHTVPSVIVNNSDKVSDILIFSTTITRINRISVAGNQRRAPPSPLLSTRHFFFLLSLFYPSFFCLSGTFSAFFYYGGPFTARDHSNSAGQSLQHGRDVVALLLLFLFFFSFLLLFLLSPPPSISVRVRIVWRTDFSENGSQLRSPPSFFNCFPDGNKGAISL